MEEQREKIEVVQLCRKVLHIIGLYYKNGLKIGTLTIPKEIQKFELKLTCGALLASFFCVQIEINYFDLIVESDLIRKSIDHLQFVVNERCRNSIKAFEIYKRQEEKNTKLGLLLAKFSTVVMSSACGIPMLFPISYAIFGFPHFWPLPFPTDVGMDITTYLGFYVAMIDQTMTIFVYFLLVTSLALLHVNICLYVNAYFQDFVGLCDDINDLASDTTINSCNFNKMYEKNFQIKGLIKAAIGLHNELFKLLNYIQTIISVPLTTQMISFTVFIALSLLNLENGITDISFDFVIGLDCLLTQALVFFVTCYLCTGMTHCSAKVSNSVYNVIWYQFPVIQQKYIILMIARAQKPFYLYGSRMFIISLETYLKLMRASVSCYLMFRQLSGAY